MLCLKGNYTIGAYVFIMCVCYLGVVLQDSFTIRGSAVAQAEALSYFDVTQSSLLVVRLNLREIERAVGRRSFRTRMRWNCR